METEILLTNFANQIKAGFGPYISYDETQQWPDGMLDELLDMGVLVETTPATQVICRECPDECTVSPGIETLPKTNETAGMFLCKKEGGLGLLKMPLERLRRWEIIEDKLVELGYYQETEKPNEDKTIIKLNDFSKGTGSRKLLEDLILDTGREGVRLNKARHGKNQPRDLKEVLRRQDHPYPYVAANIKSRKKVITLDIPFHKIVTGPNEVKK